ncbi:Ltp family lipoprotein [Arthrobacter sp. ISL-48]|uniref:Ltp family lipoprotein n=1 Tax=Arthrobacter sp. ISL-48 TaxID=2819110 RepID=UPI001BE642B2|nr:Ltp family lipoprotein [Arthrobacter sp. ISL-48]MBT2532929.1 Ltp family lipoprotein [Arthrobacter sp. ISL-48]
MGRTDQTVHRNCPEPGLSLSRGRGQGNSAFDSSFHCALPGRHLVLATQDAGGAKEDWIEQAVKNAASYLKITSFAHEGLKNQLIFDGFTPAQAEFGVSQTGL